MFLQFLISERLLSVKCLLLHCVQPKSEDQIRQQITVIECDRSLCRPVGFPSRHLPLLHVLFKLVFFFSGYLILVRTSLLLHCCYITTSLWWTDKWSINTSGHLSPEEPSWAAGVKTASKLPVLNSSTALCSSQLGSGRARCHSNNKMTHLTFASTSQCPAESGSQPGLAALGPFTSQPAECF